MSNIEVFIAPTADRIEISGDAESLEALGALLISKSKLGHNLSATYTDDGGTEIEINLTSEL